MGIKMKNTQYKDPKFQVTPQIVNVIIYFDF